MKDTIITQLKGLHGSTEPYITRAHEILNTIDDNTGIFMIVFFVTLYLLLCLTEGRLLPLTKRFHVRKSFLYAFPIVLTASFILSVLITLVLLQNITP